MLSHLFYKSHLFQAAGLIAACVLAASCAGLPATLAPAPIAVQPTRSGELTLFHFSTQPVTATPQALPSSTMQPTITPTPRTHIVKKGDSLFGVALQYGVPYDALIAANPDVNPNIMSVGTVLIIPGASEETPANNAETPAYPTPTAIPVRLGTVDCAATRDGGLWCVQLVTNEQDIPLEGVTAVFRLTDPQSQAVTELPASLPLDRLLPGQTLPLGVFFPAPVPNHSQASTTLVTSLPNPDDGRYLAAHFDQESIEIAEDGLSATVSIQVALDQSQAAAKVIRVAAVAYDEQGRVAGVRRWQNSEGQTILAGQTLPVTLFVYSNTTAIHQVALAVETRP